MVYLIVFLPLLGSIIAGFWGRRLGDKLSLYLTSTLLLISMTLSWITFWQLSSNHVDKVYPLMEWMNIGDFNVVWSLRHDMLSAVMMIVITTVSAMVHIYSIGYMSHDNSKPRFMSYLSLFTFAMLMLVTSDNLIQLFFGWEGVGLASYLLIGFWYHKPSAHTAAMKAFIVNRVGDFGFILGIIAIYSVFGSLYFDEIFSDVEGLHKLSIVMLGFKINVIELIAILLFIGAMGKSAQIGLHTWLPDAMEGPTPVSALIHAATMVTAGVFLVCRMSPLLEFAPFALNVITIVGAMTAIFAATIGLTQFDIKRVIAYSTCSQLGYMFFAAGVSAYPASMFHLTTHAFFKALLFLGAGSVIHAMSDEQDMRKMGGIWKKIPITYALMWVGSLALAGIPFFAGYYSKDLILEAAWAASSNSGYFAFWLGCLAAFLTAFYSWRVLLLTFHGNFNSSKEVLEHVHESPIVMLIPLFVLALGAIFSGWYFYNDFVGYNWKEFWGNSIFISEKNKAFKLAHYVPLWVKYLPIFLAILGILCAYLFYVLNPNLPKILSKKFSPIYNLFFNKWYFDELYDYLFVKSFIKFGNYFWKKGDEGTIDRFGPNGISKLVKNISSKSIIIQSGYIYHYAFAMLIGLVVLITWLLLDYGI
ncbi:MAG: NADH:ubiquinone oxidoreductase subunit L [Alphaproteobacteria bacterium]|nr:MAG: NADH:ubiquinone oxidoreductase subunit L [Alphaproteobacteria bacterium]